VGKRRSRASAAGGCARLNRAEGPGQAMTATRPPRGWAARDENLGPSGQGSKQQVVVRRGSKGSPWAGG
jgi:hypothetical protein